MQAKIDRKKIISRVLIIAELAIFRAQFSSVIVTTVYENKSSGYPIYSILKYTVYSERKAVVIMLSVE